MATKKLNKAYIGIIVLAVLMVAYYAFTFITIHERAGDDGRTTGWYYQVFRRLLIEFTVIIIVLSAEAIFYYINRKIPAKRLWVRLHIFLLYFTLIIAPLLSVLIADFYINLFGNRSEYWEFLFKLRNVIMIAAVVMAHVYFLMVISQVILAKKNKKQEEDMEHFLKDQPE